MLSSRFRSGRRRLHGAEAHPSLQRGEEGELSSRLRDLMRGEGVFLDIHGAMAVEGLDDPEADLAAAIRALVGSDCLIAVSSDLHGNVTPEFVGVVAMITTYRTAPHEDVLETRERACRLLLHCLEQGIRPLRAWIGIPVLVAGERSSTRAEPAASGYAALPAAGVVRRLAPGDPVGGEIAVVLAGGVSIIVTERRKPFHRICDFTVLGLEPTAAKVVVVKIGYLEPELHACARASLLALTPGAVNQELETLPYRRIQRPIYPFDRKFDWQPRAVVLGEEPGA